MPGFFNVSGVCKAKRVGCNEDNYDLTTGDCTICNYGWRL